jgi:predicted small secreted protein
MKMNPVEWIAFIALIFILLFIVTGCNTVAGIGKDITGLAEVGKEKITQPKQESGK